MTSYDDDDDGVISWGEINDMFGDSKLQTKSFFIEADTNKGSFTIVLSLLI